MLRNDTFSVVRMHDPAFAGVPFEAVRRYATTRDPDDLPELPPGADEPVTFHCKRLTRSQILDFVELVSLDTRKHARAFCAGVVRITGGRFGEGWEPEQSAAKNGLLSDEELDAQQIAPADLLEIGQVIYVRSVAPFDCSPHYPLQPSSLAVWEGNARRYAERTPEPAAPNSEPPKGG